MRILAILLALTLLLAGCASSGGDEAPSSSSTTTSTAVASQTQTSTTTSSTTTTTAPPAENKAPTGSLGAVATGLQANFTLNGTDPDGDALSWTLAFGDGNRTEGTQLPVTIRHTFAAAGTFTAVFTLDDGQAQSSYNVTVAATASPVTATTQDFQGGWSFANNVACLDSSAPYDAVPMTEGVTYLTFAVDPGTVGLPFVADFLSGAFIDHLLFLDAAGAILLDAEAGGTSFSWTAEGTVPPGAVLAVAFGCLGTPGEELTYHAG